MSRRPDRSTTGRSKTARSKTTRSKSARARSGGGRPRASRPHVRVSHPSDLLAIIPYLLGFHPTESVVALLARDGQVILAARMDLPPVEAADVLTDYWADLAEQQQADRLALVAYSEDREAATELLSSLVDRVPGGVLSEVLYADGERWWSITCTLACCPPDGTPYELGSHPVAAEAVWSGLAVEPDRAALAAKVQGPPESDLPQLVALVDQVLIDHGDLLLDRARSVQAIRRAVRRGLRAGELEDRQCAELALLASDLVVRDHAWALMTRADADEHLRLWGRVVSRVPPAVAAGPLGLLGMAGWISGNGALQNCCAERLAELFPSYSLGQILLDLSDRAIPPSYWEEWGTYLRGDLEGPSGASPLAGQERSH